MSKPWSYVNFDHPTTFQTLAMEPAKKKEIMDDLDAFRNSRDFYRRAGKPWKRGKSIIVIEDIDCSLNLTGDRAKQQLPPNPYEPLGSAVTLSGLLNIIDGLWSVCGGERIVVFTANHVDKIDPALIRWGRMDKHIEMSYCGFEAFKTLAKNYLDNYSHRLFVAVEEQLREVDITPADVAECPTTALRAGYGEDSAMEFLIEELKKNREEAKAAANRKVKAVGANTIFLVSSRYSRDQNRSQYAA
ncbi:hypothetical protein C2845_PM03G22480 [Panicum miliaceum]|uniref:Uncharacterized protein n=1 Tax=Panicum miliaceum TaxID=4540 RepID=A0A3L6T8N4_PANMI|nr:hypothetical protein C2845_PM03G22480 [Panicum miliaceum]